MLLCSSSSSSSSNSSIPLHESRDITGSRDGRERRWTVPSPKRPTAARATETSATAAAAAGSSCAAADTASPMSKRAAKAAEASSFRSLVSRRQKEDPQRETVAANESAVSSNTSPEGCGDEEIPRSPARGATLAALMQGEAPMGPLGAPPQRASGEAQGCKRRHTEPEEETSRCRDTAARRDRDASCPSRASSPRYKTCNKIK